MLCFSVPHHVEVIQNTPGPVLEGNILNIICEATGGNPGEVLSYSWSFEPWYKVNSELSTCINTYRELQFGNVQHTQAGVYKCEADNGAGVGKGSKEIFIACKHAFEM